MCDVIYECKDVIMKEDQREREESEEKRESV
jgi:hypothetical protein